MTETKLKATDLESTPIPQGLVAWWMGTYSSLPAGWEMANGGSSVNDPTYIKPALVGASYQHPRACAQATDTPGATGGANTHGHAVASHGHSTSGSPSGAGDYEGSVFPDSSQTGHGHTTTASSDTLASSNHEPKSVLAIPMVYTLKSGGSGRGLPRMHDHAASALPPWKIIAGWYTATPPSGWSLCDGRGVNGVTTPNMLNKFLKGVPSTGTVPGTSYTNAPHTHTTSHTHLSGTGGGRGSGAYSWNDNNHTHTLLSQSPACAAADATPEYQRIHFVCFTGHGTGGVAHPSGVLKAGDLDASLVFPRGTVLAWTDSASPPSGWCHCDGSTFSNGNPAGYSGKPDARDRFIKHVPDSSTNGGVQGGNPSHTHTAAGHGHTLQATGGQVQSKNSGSVVADGSHTHTVVSTTWAGIGNQSNLPSDYMEVAWIIRD